MNATPTCKTRCTREAERKIKAHHLEEIYQLSSELVVLHQQTGYNLTSAIQLQLARSEVYDALLIVKERSGMHNT